MFIEVPNENLWLNVNYIEYLEKVKLSDEVLVNIISKEGYECSFKTEAEADKFIKKIVNNKLNNSEINRLREERDMLWDLLKSFSHEKKLRKELSKEFLDWETTWEEKDC